MCNAITLYPYTFFLSSEIKGGGPRGSVPGSRAHGGRARCHRSERFAPLLCAQRLVGHAGAHRGPLLPGVDLRDPLEHHGRPTVNVCCPFAQVFRALMPHPVYVSKSIMCFSLLLFLSLYSSFLVLWNHLPLLFHVPMFLVCIALLRVLLFYRDASQWAKLEMYSNLALVLGTFVGLVSAMTLILVLARGGAFKWPWELYWVQTVKEFK